MDCLCRIGIDEKMWQNLSLMEMQLIGIKYRFENESTIWCDMMVYK
jgi:hypothetical protein